ncbi:hypothetical protein ACKVE0_10440 [Acinetobacter albensis]|uniref:Lipocalin-like domain-containing protein n=1 Tax=Acinetobacter albensis TaxID=1673609 RepID=A0ABW9JVQ5_9GAMM
MLKKLVLTVLGLGIVLPVQAFDKTQMNLNQDFWGTWSVYSPNAQCTETYQFSKPGQFTYTAKQKKMTGDFAILVNPDVKILDVLTMQIKTDNKKAGCTNQTVDYTNKDVNLSLKWISAKTAELCMDRRVGKQCTGLYLIKQK